MSSEEQMESKKRTTSRIAVPVLMLLAGVLLYPYHAFAGDVAPETISLASVIAYALKNNPQVRIGDLAIESETYAIRAAKGERALRADFGGGATRFRYATPVTPLVLSVPLGRGGIDAPDFEKTIYDTSVSFKLPIFKGGRLYRAVRIAEMRKELAMSNARYTRLELIYNLTGVYFKILQLEKMLLAEEARVNQLEAHRRDVDAFIKAGTAPLLDLLKTDVELAHVREGRLVVQNNLETAHELLGVLMGVDVPEGKLRLTQESTDQKGFGDAESAVQTALSKRPDYRSAMKKREIAEERIKIAKSRRLPDIQAAGDYGARSGPDFTLRENWNFGVRFTVPLFEGGIIAAEVGKEKIEAARAREEERALRLTILKEIREAFLALANSRERIEVAGKALETARETLRIERLKYEVGEGISSDVIDAQTGLIRAEMDLHQAFYDREISLALLRKAVGEEPERGE